MAARCSALFGVVLLLCTTLSYARMVLRDPPASDMHDKQMSGKDLAWRMRGVASDQETAAAARVGTASRIHTAVGSGLEFGNGMGDGMSDPETGVGEGYGSGQGHGSVLVSGEGYGWGEGSGSGSSSGSGEGWGEGAGSGSGSGSGEGFGWGEGSGSSQYGGGGQGMGEGFGQGVGPGYYGPGGMSGGSGSGGGQGIWNGGSPSGGGGGGGGGGGSGIGYPSTGCCRCGVPHFSMRFWGVPFPGLDFHHKAARGSAAINVDVHHMGQKNGAASSMTMFADGLMPPTSSEIPAHMNNAVREELLK